MLTAVPAANLVHVQKQTLPKLERMVDAAQEILPTVLPAMQTGRLVAVVQPLGKAHVLNSL